MNYYQLKYEDGTQEIAKAKTTLELIKKYDLATKKHINTSILQLDGEQLVIAISNDQEEE